MASSSDYLKLYSFNGLVMKGYSLNVSGSSVISNICRTDIISTVLILGIIFHHHSWHAKRCRYYHVSLIFCHEQEFGMTEGIRTPFHL